MFRGLSILVSVVWVFLFTTNLSGQSVKTEQEVRLENYMNNGKYITIAPSNLLDDNVRLVLPHLLPAGRSVMYVSDVSGKCATLSWQPADSIGGINRLLSGDNYFLGTSDSTAVSFYTHDSLRITITADGRVGIGTDSPSGALEVKSNRPTIISAPTGEIPDDSLENGQVAFYTIDSTGSIYAKAKKSNGSVVVQTRTAQVLQKMQVIDLPSIPITLGSNYVNYHIDFQGAVVGDAVIANPMGTMAFSLLIAWVFVSEPNKVTIGFKNFDAGLNLTGSNNPPMNFLITVFK